MLYYMVYVEVLLYLPTQSCTSWVSVSGHRRVQKLCNAHYSSGGDGVNPVVPPHAEPEGRESVLNHSSVFWISVNITQKCIWYDHRHIAP